MIGYVMLDVTNPFFGDVAQGIEEAAEAADLWLYSCNSNASAERERTYLDRLEEQRVFGVLVTPLDPDDPARTRKIRGQVSIATTPGRVRSISLLPNGAPACAAAVDAVREADVVLLATGGTPRVLPDAVPDGQRILSWRDVYDLDVVIDSSR